MEFLKGLFKDGEALTYDQLMAKAAEAKINAVNLADGAYVSKAKFDDNVNTLKQQVTDLQGQITQRNTDLTDLQAKLTAAQTDAGKLTEAQASFAKLQKQYEADAKAWEAKNQKMAYEYAIKERANAIKFTSAAAKRDFIREASAKEFKIDGDTLLGYEDFRAKYEAENPGAIEVAKAEDEGKKPPKIVPPAETAPGQPDKSLFQFHFSGVRAHD